MKVLIVASYEVADPADVAVILTKLNLPQTPGFAGEARIVVEPHASIVTDYLDGADE